MVVKLTEIAEYFRKVPAAFLVAIVTVLGLILFLPAEYAKTLAIDEFRREYRVFLGPSLLLIVAFCVARLFVAVMHGHKKRTALKERLQSLRKLTPEEKGYLAQYIEGQQNTVYVGMDDGVMSGLRRKHITYLAASMGSRINGFAFNLQPWAREYLQNYPQLLDGYAGKPMTPRQRLYSRW